MRAALSLGLCLLLTPAASWAQGQDKATDAKAQPARVVVVADSTGDETQNAQLRAKVYEAARANGWAAEGKADVMGRAQTAGALEAGSVSTTADKLEPLRSALGARALVRIFRDDKGMHVTVVTAKGAQTRDVASDAAAVSAAADLLGKVAQSGGTPAAAPATAGDGRGTASAGGSLSAGFMTPSVMSDKKEGPPPGSPEAWVERGGARLSYGVRALLTGLYIPDTPFTDTNPVNSQVEIGKGNTFGIGGGLGAHVAFMYLPIPEPVVGSANFAAFRAGVGAELNALYVRPPNGFKYRVEAGAVVSQDKEYDNQGYLYAFIPMQLGVHFMFGEHKSPTVWRGVGLGLAYSPTVIAALEIGQDQDQTETKFNYGGFELSLDLTKLETGEKANPNVRLSVMVLPKVSDDVPWLASGTIGAFWY